MKHDAFYVPKGTIDPHLHAAHVVRWKVTSRYAVHALKGFVHVVKIETSTGAEAHYEAALFERLFVEWKPRRLPT